MTTVHVLHGDSRLVLRTLPANSVDGAVGDPPYGFASIIERFGKDGAAPARGDAFNRLSGDFIGEGWDTGRDAHDAAFWRELYRVVKPGGFVVMASATKTYHRLACAIEDAGFEIRDMISWLYGSGWPKSHNHQRSGKKHGSALKPACEPFVLARKPLEGSIIANVRKWGTGALNIDGCRVELDTGEAIAEGRWPANVAHDGSAEVIQAFPPARGQIARAKDGGGPMVHAVYGARDNVASPPSPRGDAGSAARFFYCAKATKADRAGSKHPTVKPVALMQWLCRLVIPPGGVVIDPFAGSGTTGAAALREGMSAILIEAAEKYVADIHRRIALERGKAAA